VNFCDRTVHDPNPLAFFRKTLATPDKKREHQMTESLAIELQPYVAQAVNSLIFFAFLALLAAAILIPKTKSGYWSWHPIKRLLVAIFLTPVLLLCIFIWPLVLLGWLLRSRCHCQNCQDDD